MIYKLNEDTRWKLISQSKRSEKGRERLQRRFDCSISSSNSTYNNIDMDKLFKLGIFSIDIPVIGVTDNYIVNVTFSGFTDKVQEKLKNSDEQINLSIIINALNRCFTEEDSFVNCSCPDMYYRFSYVATKNDYKSGEPQTIPAPIRNPFNNLGSCCKHLLLVLNNTKWLVKSAIIIKNYIQYMERTNKKMYINIIYPALYGRDYEETPESQEEIQQSEEEES